MSGTSSSPVTMPRPGRPSGAASAALALLVLAGGTASPAASSPAHAALPEIRTSAHNGVPACATPERLMAFTRDRNGHLDVQFRDIARYYKQHGEHWRVRWDYAYFQMLVETNYLTFRRPDGDRGEVHPRQNNFAGLGATGGVSGDSFANVSTGVLAQIQHLVVYSGERIAHPTAPRTQLKMDDIIALSRVSERPVTFRDLAGRWASDRAYARSIEGTAQAFLTAYCNGRPMAEDSQPRRLRTRAEQRGAEHRGAERYAESERQDDEKPAARNRLPVRRPATTGSLAGQTKEVETGAGESSTGEANVRIPARGLPAAPPPVISMKSPPPSTGAAAAAAPPAKPPEAETKPAQEPQANPIATGAAGQAQASEPRSAQVAAATPAPAPRTTAPCKIFRASYGGPKTVLIQSQKEQVTNYTVLEVIAGKEQEQTKAFMDAHARGGKIIGEFPLQADALKKSFELCPSG